MGFVLAIPAKSLLVWAAPAKFLQISKPAQAGFVPRCDTCAGLRPGVPLFLPIEVPQFGMDSSVVLPQPADIAGLLLADHLAVLELPLELDDLTQRRAPALYRALFLLRASCCLTSEQVRVIAELLAARASFTTKAAPMFSIGQGGGKWR